MRAKMVFVSTPLLPVVQAAAAEVASVKQIIVAGGGPDQLPRLEALLAAEREAAAPAATCVDEVAYWLYSSGTTGMPKGIMHVYSSPMYMARLAGERLGIREDDLVFSAAKAFLPMDLYGPGNSIVCPGSIEATSILYPERPTLQTVFETLRSHQPTMFYGVPTLYAAILAAPNCVPEMSSSRLRLCFSAGKPLPEHIGHSWKARFGLDIVNRVGSTEMGHLFLTNLPDAVDYSASGVAVKGYDLKLVDEGGERSPTASSANSWSGGLLRRPGTGTNASGRVAPSRASGPGPATNTPAVTGSIPIAGAPTTCSRSAAAGCCRSRSKRCSSAIQACLKLRWWRPRTPMASPS